jgi:hypothetical protein
LTLEGPPNSHESIFAPEIQTNNERGNFGSTTAEFGLLRHIHMAGERRDFFATP